MTHAIPLLTIWQALLLSFRWAFIQPEFQRFAEWITALAIKPEEHTITRSVTAIERLDDWVILAALPRNPDRPAWFLPLSGRLYFRKSQLPAENADCRRLVEFRTKCALAAELIREQGRLIPGRHLTVFDGGHALHTLVRPLIAPDDGSLHIAFLTRLRQDARLYALPPIQRRPGQREPLPKWGKKPPPPRQDRRWKRGWQVACSLRSRGCSAQDIQRRAEPCASQGHPLRRIALPECVAGSGSSECL